MAGIATGSRTAALVERAERVFPGGVNSPVRAFRSVGRPPVVLERGEGPYVWDADRRRYLDHIGAWGPAILGHAHPLVVEAVNNAARNGFALGATHPLEIELGEAIQRAMPSMERLRFTSSGTEAVMSALRVARAATGRNLVVKFAGAYHGHSDGLLVEAGSGLATQAIAGSAGVPDAVAATAIVLPFNDRPAVTEAFAAHTGEIAAVIVEPVVANAGVIPPTPGYLEHLRAVTSADNALLVFDEVITGFRLGSGGAQSRFGITPDLTTLGKIIGGGMPIGAYGGRADLMDLVAPAGPVYQAGTLSGHPLSMAAGIATLHELTEDRYATLEESAARLAAGLADAASSAGREVAVARVGSLLTIFFRSSPPADAADALASDRDAYARFFGAMLDQGILLPPSQFEAWFVSMAHGPAEMGATLDAASNGVRVMNDRFLRACRLEPVDATPVWFMRQAGRSFAAYRKLRERYGIIELAKTPELCAEVTLMPVHELGVDAAVLFADIMLPLEPMGVGLRIEPEVGPIIDRPIRSAADVAALRPFDPTEVSSTLDAIRIVRRDLNGSAGVIGFSGAPFTLACYLIEGRPSRDFATAKSFMYREPATWDDLMERLSSMVVAYLRAQIEAGADVVQVFDSWVGGLGPADYAIFVQPHVKRIFDALADVPTIHFGTGTSALLELMADAGGDVIGVDHRVSLGDAWGRIGFDRGIQGNLDAARVVAGWEPTDAGARAVLAEAGGHMGHIFNLGHGVMPETDTGLLRRLVELVHQETARSEARHEVVT